MIRKLALFACLATLAGEYASAGTQQDIEAAARAGNPAFVVVYDATALEIEQARQLADAAAARVPGAARVDIDRAEVANVEFVTKYKLASAPVPLVLVCSRTGVVTSGGLAIHLTVDQLVKSIPSPKKTEIIKELSEGHSVIVTVSRKDMKSAEAVFSACAVACQQMAGKSVAVTIDMDDEAELTFLQELKINRESTEPITLVANATGQIAGMYTGAVQVTDLVTAANKKVGGCCPSTVSNPNASCDPPKK